MLFKKDNYNKEILSYPHHWKGKDASYKPFQENPLFKVFDITQYRTPIKHDRYPMESDNYHL